MTGARWTAVRVHGATDRPAVIQALFASGAEGVQELENDVLTHLRDVNEAALRDRIAAADPEAHAELSPTPDVDWSAEWRSRIRAHRVGRLVITPPWLADRYEPAERVVIEPQMAFGTGEHETTRGVARLMQRVVRPDDVVADLGAGSAVLSIAAARLGARRVIAIENDPDAIANAEENVRRNGVEDRVTVIEGDAGALLALVAPVRVVFANIISSVLLELLPAIAGSLVTDGEAILSGMLLEERPGMESAFAASGWRVRDADAEGAWWSATIART